MKSNSDDSDYDISFKPRRGYTLIFRPWFIHPRTKKVVYPKKSKVFPIWIKHRRQLELPIDLDGPGLN